MFKMAVFDLDGTLAPSKGRIDEEMSSLLCELLKEYTVSVISGGDYPQFEKQILPYLSGDTELLKNLILCPTCSTKMYEYSKEGWKKRYSLDLRDSERNFIITILEKAISDLGLTPKQTWGALIEDRGTQITYSALGQQAPIEAKAEWDSNGEKRKKIRSYLENELLEYEILLGGTTSLDITRKGVNKGFGIEKLMEVTGYTKDEIIFVGDAVYQEGNDYPPLVMGVPTKRIYGIDDTKIFIRTLISHQ